MSLFGDIRAAIVTKADTDVTALRRATRGRVRRGIGGLPQVFVFIPSGTMESRPGGSTEKYTLTFPGKLEIGTPEGEKRADDEAEDLVNALLIAWRSGIQLGLGSRGVVGSWLSAWSPSYSDEDVLDGYDLTWTVEMLETLNPGRTV